MTPGIYREETTRVHKGNIAKAGSVFLVVTYKINKSKYVSSIQVNYNLPVAVKKQVFSDMLSNLKKKYAL